MKARSRRSRPISAAEPAPLLADVLAALTDAVVVIDRQGAVRLLNPAAEELIGLPQRRVLGAPCARIFAETPLVSEMVQRVQALGQSEAHNEAWLARRRRSVPVRLTCTPLWDAADGVSGAVLIIHDLSSQRTLEESIRRNENLARLGTLVAGLAHEVRNPLAGIIGAAQLLEQRLAGQNEVAEYTAVIGREGRRLSRLVDDLLTLGSAAPPRRTPTNIHRVIQDVVATLGPELAAAGVALHCAFDPSLPDVLADPAQLSQVLHNVVRNALEATLRAGTVPAAPNPITISTRMETDFHLLRGSNRAGAFLRIEVADQGTGLDAATAAQMFEPFVTTKARGTGLGLAITAKIVAEHGGIVRAGANHPRGTTISISLPVARR